MKLSNREILQIICKFCVWLYTNTKAPSSSMIHCEALIYNFMTLMFDDFSREYLPATTSSGGYVEILLSALTENTLVS